MMMAPEVLECRKLGGDWPQKISETLATARSNTRGFLPDTLWDALRDPAWTMEGRPAAKVAAKDCQEFIKYYSDPRLKFRLHGDVVKGLMSASVYRCMAASPALAVEVKEAWRAALARKDLPLDEAEITAGRKEWQWRLRNAPRNTADSERDMKQCRQVIQDLSSPQFDAVFSEENVQRHLLEDLDKK